MSVHSAKITAVLILLSLVFAGSCQIDTDHSDKLQVYNEDGTPFIGLPD